MQYAAYVQGETRVRSNGRRTHKGTAEPRCVRVCASTGGRKEPKSRVGERVGAAGAAYGVSVVRW